MDLDPALGGGLQGSMPSSFGDVNGMLAQSAARDALRKQLAATMLMNQLQRASGGRYGAPPGLFNSGMPQSPAAGIVAPSAPQAPKPYSPF